MPIEIKLIKPKTEKIGQSFFSLVDLMEQLSFAEIQNSIVIDLSELDFIHPVLASTISAIIKHPKFNGFDINFNCKRLESYLKTVFFPNGFDVADLGIDFLEQFKTKTYLPICRIPASAKETKVREQLLTVFENILINQLKLSGQIISVVKYVIGESMDNIVEHADTPFGWIMVQNYPAKGFLDICICETGIGILGSYQKTNFTDVTSDIEALKQAINGKSTKQIAETRGYGIDTSRRMLVDGLGGQYFLMSGSALYVYTNEIEQIIPLDCTKHWPGTVLALRIPKTVPVSFNYTKYLE